MADSLRDAARGSEPDWARQREQMVASQIQGRGVSDPRVLAALRRVPRHEFVPFGCRFSAYADTPLPIGQGQTISQPFMVALMMEALRVRQGDRVLEIGTGSGYQAALLAELGCRVHTVECVEELADRAETTLTRLGYDSVRLYRGDGTLGLPDESPFRRILVTAGGPRVPAPLREQLEREQGVLVIPVGDRLLQRLVRVTRKGEEFAEEDLGGCRFVPLLGEEGW